jgi:hypothetical protein
MYVSESLTTGKWKPASPPGCAKRVTLAQHFLSFLLGMSCSFCLQNQQVDLGVALPPSREGENKAP